eukprot:UN18351
MLSSRLRPNDFSPKILELTTPRSKYWLSDQTDLTRKHDEIFTTKDISQMENICDLKSFEQRSHGNLPQERR